MYCLVLFLIYLPTLLLCVLPMAELFLLSNVFLAYVFFYRTSACAIIHSTVIFIIIIIIIIIIRFYGLSKQLAFIAQLVAVNDFVQSGVQDLQ